MYQHLKEKLWSFIVHNNPDLMFNLQDDYRVTEYLETKISQVMPTAMKLLEQGKEGYAILELCMNEMTAELKPSRYHYIAALVKEEFPEEFVRLREAGLLSYETVNLVDHCKETFDVSGFCEQNFSDKIIKEQITGKILDYFKQAK